MHSASEVKRVAIDCGFDLAGIASAGPPGDIGRYLDWVAAGMAGEMRYLTDYRADRRRDPRSLLDSARSILCVGKVYNGPEPYTPGLSNSDRAWISRYAWGDDYHDVMRAGLLRVVERLRHSHPALEYKICVDTAPLLERSYGRAAGLGWIGKNTCLINEAKGSWFFLGEALLSLELEPDGAVADRCGSCSACIDACPTSALRAHELDARRCLSYLTIELRGDVPEPLRGAAGTHVFGCDICQDVCPWNRRAPVSDEPAFASRHHAPPLERLAHLREPEFRDMFRGTPVTRTKYAGFLRNVAIAIGNSGNPRLRGALEHLAAHENAIVARHAVDALAQLDLNLQCK